MMYPDEKGQSGVKFSAVVIHSVKYRLTLEFESLIHYVNNSLKLTEKLKIAIVLNVIAVVVGRSPPDLKGVSMPPKKNGSVSSESGSTDNLKRARAFKKISNKKISIDDRVRVAVEAGFDRMSHLPTQVIIALTALAFDVRWDDRENNTLLLNLLDGILDKHVSAALWDTRGTICHRLGYYRRALESYDKAIKLTPNDASSYYNYAQTLRMGDEVKKAIGYYQTAINLEPDDQAYRHDFCEYLLYVNYPDASKLISDVSHKFSNKERRLYEDGCKMLQASNFTESIEAAKRFVKCVHKSSPRMRRVLSKFEERMTEALAGRKSDGKENQRYLEGAIEVMELATTKFPRVWDYLAGLANLYDLAGLKESAFEAYEKVIKARPRDIISMQNYADALITAGKIREAHKVLEKAHQINPDDEQILYFLDEVQNTKEAARKAKELGEAVMDAGKSAKGRASHGGLFGGFQKARRQDEFDRVEVDYGSAPPSPVSF